MPASYRRIEPGNQRDFLGQAVLAGSAAAGVVATKTLSKSRTAASESIAVPDRYCDVHVHLTQPWYGREHGGEHKCELPIDHPLNMRHFDLFTRFRLPADVVRQIAYDNARQLFALPT